MIIAETRPGHGGIQQPDFGIDGDVSTQIVTAQQGAEFSPDTKLLLDELTTAPGGVSTSMLVAGIVLGSGRPVVLVRENLAAYLALANQELAPTGRAIQKIDQGKHDIIYGLVPLEKPDGKLHAQPEAALPPLPTDPPFQSATAITHVIHDGTKQPKPSTIRPEALRRLPETLTRDRLLHSQTVFTPPSQRPESQHGEIDTKRSERLTHIRDAIRYIVVRDILAQILRTGDLEGINTDPIALINSHLRLEERIQQFSDKSLNEKCKKQVANWIIQALTSIWIRLDSESELELKDSRESTVRNQCRNLTRRHWNFGRTNLAIRNHFGMRNGRNGIKT